MATESRARRPIQILLPETEKKPATLRLVTALLGLGQIGNFVAQNAQRAIQDAVRWKRHGANIIVAQTNGDSADDNLGRRLPDRVADGHLRSTVPSGLRVVKAFRVTIT